MGTSRVGGCDTPEEIRATQRAILEDLRALEWMLDRGLLVAPEQRIGAELECFLVDPTGEPAPLAPAVLPMLDARRFAPEVSRFELEANLSVRPLGGDCFSRMEVESRSLLAWAEQVTRGQGARLALTGILPTIAWRHLRREWMTSSPRFDLLERVTMAAEGGELHLAIRGIDELELRLRSMMLEGAATSFQVHLQVSSEDFARTYNAAQLAIAPVLAVAANSPLLLGRRLWHETRVPMLEAAASLRGVAQQRRGTPRREGFGTRWVRGSVLELFREDFLQHEPVLAAQPGSPPFAELAAGRAPALTELCTFNGTVWRWNRPCYGVSEGRPRLRIECRALPSGPTVTDQVANAAFWIGLTLGLIGAYGDVAEQVEFRDARTNFYEAARQGLEARLRWFDGKRHPVRRLISSELLPLARQGLAAAGVAQDDADRYLGVIERRVTRGRNGALWLLEAFETLGERPDRDRSLSAAVVSRSLSSEPVDSWEPFRPPSPRAQDLPIEAFVTIDVPTLRPYDGPERVGELLRERSIAVVEEPDGTFAGVVSRDSWIAALTSGARWIVDRLVERDWPVLTLDASAVEALAFARSRQLDALVVVDEHRRFCGTVNRSALEDWLRGTPASPSVEESIPSP